MELWKDIQDYEGFYQISNKGRVKSMARVEKTANRWGKHSRRRKEFILKLTPVNGRYLSIELNKNGKAERRLIHRLVYSHFGAPLEKDKCVHHLDENKTNNSIENLAQITYIEHNNIHKHAPWNKGLKGYKTGKRDKEIYNNLRKKVICVETGIIFPSVNEAAKSVNRNANCITRCLKNNKYRTNGLHFKYYKEDIKENDK